MNGVLHNKSAIAKSLIVLWSLFLLVCAHGGCGSLLVAESSSDHHSVVEQVQPSHCLREQPENGGGGGTISCNQYLLSTFSAKQDATISFDSSIGLILVITLTSLSAVLRLPISPRPQPIPVAIPIPTTKRFHRYND